MTIEELKVVISAKTEKLQEGINKATNRLKDFKKSSNDTSSAMGGSVKEMQKKLESLNSSFEKTQEKILGIKEELGRLDAARDEIIDSYKDFPAFSGMTKDESLEQMLKSDSSFQKLSEEIDRLQTRMQPLIDKNNQTKKEMGELGEAINNAGKRAENAGNKFNEAGEKVRRLGIRSRLAGKHIFEAGNKVTRLAHVIDMSLKRVLRRIFIYAVMYKAIRGMIDYLNAALKTNKEFVRSLNVIRTNLRVAFQPIYEFVLPALNALMRGIATVTTYIASAISALFGKTYKQSYNAAKGLEKTKKNMAGVGGAAKKAGKEIKGALAPFDELNTLNLDKDSDDSGGGGGAGDFEMLPMDQIDTSGLDEFKEKLATIFEPFKKAWENEGQATIDAIKYAFGEIKELIKAIGRSWVEVWTNGTGQAILETTLRILQNIFNTIGDIAQSFTKAWTEAGLGTSIMQHIHNIILHILTLAERLTGAFREVWGEVGDKLAKIFLETLNNILATLDHLGEKLVWVWDNGGEHLFKGFMKLGAKIAELVMFILNEFVLPFVNWFIDLMAPAVAKLCDWIGNLLDKFVELIDWLMGDGYPALEAIVTILGSLAIAFGVVKAAIVAKTVVLNIYKTAMSAAFIMGESFKGGLAAFLGPAGIAVAAITSVITVGVLLYKHWDEISAWLKKTWESIKEAAVKTWGAIKEFFIKTWDAIKEKTSEIWNAIKEFLKDIWDGIKKAAQTTWDGIKKVILTPIKVAQTELTRIWNAIKIFILGKWNEIKQGILSMKNALVDAMMSPFKIADKQIHGVIGDARNWGRNLIQNFIDGINAMIGKVKNAVTKVADTVADRLGFHSPAKKGPGKDADKWMPNLMDMMAEGIENNVYKIEGSVDMTARTLQGMKSTNNVDSIASALAGAIGANNNNGGDMTVVVKIGEDTITEKVISNINRQSRISGKTVIQV